LKLHVVSKEKGWVDKECLKDYLNIIYTDAAGNKVKTDFLLATEYDLSKWK
jgi:hypothetical protein